MRYPSTLARVGLIGLAFAAANGCSTSGSSADDDANPTSSTSTTTASSTTVSTAATTSATTSSTAGGSSTATTGGDDSSTTATSTAASDDSTGEMIYGCDGLDPGPFPPFALFGSIGVFVGSEDMGFDGRGHAVVRDADTVYLLDYDLGSIVDFPLADPSYGLRFHPNGNILAAMYSDNEIRQITPAGDASAFATGVGSVNGLHPDHDGNVWYTNFSAVVRLDANGENPVTIASGSEANGANGVYFDADRSLLFYTQYGAGIIRKVAIDSSGNPGTNESIATIDGNLDGMAMDVQGNLYVVDNEGNDIYRVCLDEAGDRVGDSQLLTNAPTEDNIANVVFGDPNPELAANETWAPDALYAIGVDGTIYQIEVGVAGKPIPQVPDA